MSCAEILAAHRDGVTVICELAAQFTDATWLAATPCADWRAVDLAGHLRCVADDYHEYLDDAPASRLARLMATGAPADSLGRMSASDSKLSIYAAIGANLAIATTKLIAAAISGRRRAGSPASSM